MKISQFITWLIHLILGLAELLISFRIILKLFGASTSATFVRWVYETSEPLLKPFVGAFPHPTLSGGFVIEFSALFALLVYALIDYVLIDVINELSSRADKRN